MIIDNYPEPIGISEYHTIATAMNHNRINEAVSTIKNRQFP